MSRMRSAMSEDPQLGDLLDYMEKLKNYEWLGVLKGTGMDTGDDFDLGRMKQLLQRLGNPHTQFKVCNNFRERMLFWFIDCWIFFMLMVSSKHH